MRTLKNNKVIVIKPADIGTKIVILDRVNYIYEALRQLGNSKHYRPLHTSIFLKTQKKVRDILHSLLRKKR